MLIETHTASDPIATGAHAGSDSANSLYVKRGFFKTCGIQVGSPIYNTTQVTDGLITAITETTITDDTNSWDNGDLYEVYVQTKDSYISHIVIDKRYGRKTNPAEMENDLHKNDIDLDEYEDNVFGSGQPSGSYKW